jgi:hypothetical protein
MNAKTVSISHRLAMTMAVVAIILIAAAGARATEPQPEGPVTTAFTYQGRLTSDGGDPIDDSCDFQFGLWDDPDAGSPVGPALNLPGVAVADGLFTVQLDFGSVFDISALWLEVAVQCTGDPGYTTLAPRQALTAAPFATSAARALDAHTVDGLHAGAFAPDGHDHWGETWTGTGYALTLDSEYMGLSSTGSYYGVQAIADSGSNWGYGVYAQTNASDGYGVLGLATASTGYAVGVHGSSSANNGYGGQFESSGLGATTTTAGVYGRSLGDAAYGVIGVNTSNGSGVGAWSYTGHIYQGYSGSYPVGTLQFYVTHAGEVHANGPYVQFKATGGQPVEHRAVYGMTSAEAWTEDFGRATLKNGTATVTIDPAFAETVNLALEYHIYLTPICGDLIVLAVTGQQPDLFTVKGATLDGKASGCAFDYRIVARQRGYEGRRLEKVDPPKPVEAQAGGVP